MPADFDAARRHFENGLRHQGEGRLEAAAASYRLSLEQLPGRPSTLTNLGAVLLKLQRPAEALPLLQQALQAEPGSVEALSQQALALADSGRDTEALAAFDALLARTPGGAAVPGLPGVHYHRGLCLARLNRPHDALAAIDAALAIDDGAPEAWASRGGLLKDLGRADEAIAALQRALALGADSAVNGYLLASLTGGAAPPAAPAPYVQQLFDAYAPQFEQHLVDGLHYRVPEQLVALAVRHGCSGAEQALDLGCGTGLCAAPLKALAGVRQLHGVDLSAGMLQRAAAGGQYERLWQADIAAWLAGCDERYALVIAADVFIYIGDLDTVVAGARRLLLPGGCFCFSVERADGAADYLLGSGSRYAHSERYLQALAARHGFAAAALEPAVLRCDQRRPVAGLLACFSPA